MFVRTEWVLPRHLGQEVGNVQWGLRGCSFRRQVGFCEALLPTAVAWVRDEAEKAGKGAQM